MLAGMHCHTVRVFQEEVIELLSELFLLGLTDKRLSS